MTKNLKKFFLTKKQVLKVKDKYVARYKRWFHLRWRYIGITESWSEDHIYYCTNRTKEDAMYKLDEWFKKRQKIEKKIIFEVIE